MSTRFYPGRRRAVRAVAALAAAALHCPRPASAAPVAAGPPSFEQGRVWRVSRADLPPSYVCGTIHVRDARTLPFRQSLAPLLRQSRTLAVENHLGPADRERFAEAARLDGGRRLDALLSPRQFDRLVARLAEQGMEATTVATLKPWAALLSIAPRPVDPDTLTLEEWLLAARRTGRMELLALELPDEQVASLDAIPVSAQLALLGHALSHEDELHAQYEDVLTRWLAGDLVGLKRLHDANGRSDPGLAQAYAALFRHLIVDRSHLMAHRLHLPLARGAVLVAVGALHLYGANSLLARIAEQGYHVQRVMR